ncbi:M20 family metallopeptidase [Paenarthrobacter sp. NCHU4564]|uniref:M20 family metallopeptidase n=1 Tax=Paenarthrobacter sp. NCHU4564 TaxID=3451353 RepID=UPI003F9D94C1
MTSTTQGAKPQHHIPAADEEFLRSAVARSADSMLHISHAIHAHPEVRFEERFACGLLTDVLRSEGFEVQSGVGGLETAFLAERSFGDGGPTIAFFCEYDALEEIGHGCGHNVIAAVGIGAALATKEWMAENPAVRGRIVVVGSPAEEGGGGKMFLIDSGALDGIDAALMIHPSGENLTCMTTLARMLLEFEFTGKAAHAAVSPERGVNALDAAVLTLNAIGLLRQQMPSDARVHAVITDGGEVPNIIPEKAAIRAFVRSPDTEFLLSDLVPRVENCARGAALSTGTSVDIKTPVPLYASLQPNEMLGQLVEENFHRIGRRTEPPRTEVFPGSTDMGNVSQILPVIHANVELVPGLGMHSRDAAALAGGEAGDRAVLDGALLLSMTAVQLLSSTDLLQGVKDTFVEGFRLPPRDAADALNGEHVSS